MSIQFGGDFQPVQTARAAAVLEAAGAFDPTPTEMPCPYADHVTFYITYTRGAVGGDAQFRVEPSPYSSDQAGVEDWFLASVFAAGGVVSGVDTLSNLQRGNVEYGSTGAGAETVVYGPFLLRKTAERIRFLARESGVLGTPGTMHVVAMFGFIEETV